MALDHTLDGNYWKTEAGSRKRPRKVRNPEKFDTLTTGDVWNLQKAAALQQAIQTHPVWKPKQIQTAVFLCLLILTS